MKRVFILGFIATSLFALAGSLHAQATPPYARTIIVAPVPGDAIASGDALRNAVASANPSGSHRWNIQLEPGIFDLGRNYLQLRSWVNIEGAGSDLTVIRGNGQEIIDRSRGVVQGATTAELSRLKIDCVSEGNDTGCIAMANLNASPRLTDVKILVKGGNTQHWGMRNSGSSPVLENVEILTSGGLHNYGLVNGNGPGGVTSAAIIRRSRIKAVNGSSQNVGVLNKENSTAALIEDTEIEAWGGSLAAGIQAFSPGSLIDEMVLRRATLTVWGATQTYGVLDGRYETLSISDSEILVSGANSFGVVPDLTLHPVTKVRIRDSRIDAASKIVAGPDVLVVGSWLRGGGTVTGFVLHCAATVDGSLQFHPTGCP